MPPQMIRKVPAVFAKSLAKKWTQAEFMEAIALLRQIPGVVLNIPDPSWRRPAELLLGDAAAVMWTRVTLSEELQLPQPLADKLFALLDPYVRGCAA
jgi:hypothetical protein